MRDLPDCNWGVRPDPRGNFTLEQAQLAVLMDIREQLKELARDIREITRCDRFLTIPNELAPIRRNTTKKRKRATK